MFGLKFLTEERDKDRTDWHSASSPEVLLLPFSHLTQTNYLFAVKDKASLTLNWELTVGLRLAVPIFSSLFLLPTFSNKS